MLFICRCIRHRVIKERLNTPVYLYNKQLLQLITNPLPTLLCCCYTWIVPNTKALYLCKCFYVRGGGFGTETSINLLNITGIDGASGQHPPAHRQRCLLFGCSRTKMTFIAGEMSRIPRERKLLLLMNPPKCGFL